jgi:hypothetical protein
MNFPNWSDLNVSLPSWVMETKESAVDYLNSWLPENPEERNKILGITGIFMMVIGSLPIIHHHTKGFFRKKLTPVTEIKKEVVQNKVLEERTSSQTGTAPQGAITGEEDTTISIQKLQDEEDILSQKLQDEEDILSQKLQDEEDILSQKLHKKNIAKGEEKYNQGKEYFEEFLGKLEVDLSSSECYYNCANEYGHSEASKELELIKKLKNVLKEVRCEGEESSDSFKASSKREEYYKQGKEKLKKGLQQAEHRLENSIIEYKDAKNCGYVSASKQIQMIQKVQKVMIEVWDFVKDKSATDKEEITGDEKLYVAYITPSNSSSSSSSSSNEQDRTVDEQESAREKTLKLDEYLTNELLKENISNKNISDEVEKVKQDETVSRADIQTKEKPNIPLLQLPSSAVSEETFTITPSTEETTSAREKETNVANLPGIIREKSSGRVTISNNKNVLSIIDVFDQPVPGESTLVKSQEMTDATSVQEDPTNTILESSEDSETSPEEPIIYQQTLTTSGSDTPSEPEVPTTSNKTDPSSH